MLWAVLLPAIQAVVLAVILKRVARISVPHYPTFIFSGMVAWMFISTTVTAGATSIVDNSALSSRIYFPRAILPLATCLSNFFAFAISAILALVYGLAVGVPFGPHLLYIFPGSLLLISFASGLTLVLSAIHVYFRDTRFFVQALIQPWFYLTPIFYPLNLLHGTARTLITVNPMTGVAGLLHSAVLGGTPPVRAVWITLVWTGAFLAAALVLHRRFDRTFADLL